MRLTPGKVMNGQIYFKGEDLLNKTEKEMEQLRGKDIAMIFQEPMTSLNPVFTIGNQVTEAIKVHQKNKKNKSLRQHAIKLLEMVGIPRAESILNEYPHQLSGGMRQRVMIAIAMACNPSLLIADEPTTALDVTIQAQILDLMLGLQREYGTSIIIITHDLGVVAEMCDRVCVMYGGKIVEESSVKNLFKNPLHPYSQGLLKSIPSILEENEEELYSIKGNVPDPGSMEQGCYFAPRCEYAMDICFKQAPQLKEIAPKHYSSCWLHERSEKNERVTTRS